MSQPVSIIIVNYNAGDLLARSLEALRKQTLRPRHIYVIDNASRDGSCDRIATDFPEVTLIRNEQNIGFAAGNNLAVRRADGCEWIALLNPDAFPEPKWLEALMDAAARHPEYSFFGSRMNGFGCAARDTGHNRAPMPPERMTGTRLFIGQDLRRNCDTSES